MGLGLTNLASVAIHKTS